MEQRTHVSIAAYKQKYPAAFEFTPSDIKADLSGANVSLLQQYDTVFLIDDSTSMTIRDGDNQKSRWTTAGIWLGLLAEIAAQYDRDGIDIYFFNNSQIAGKQLKSRYDVERIFNSVQYLISGTPIKSSILRILTAYFSRMQREEKVKPLNLIVITDGAPYPSSENPTQAIDYCIGVLDHYGVRHDFRQVGIMFAQVGNDSTAQQLLQSLDDKYKNSKKRDIVDTLKGNLSLMTPADRSFAIVKLLMGAIDKNLDNTNSRPVAAAYYQQQPTSQYAGVSTSSYQPPNQPYNSPPSYGYPQQQPWSGYPPQQQQWQQPYPPQQQYWQPNAAPPPYSSVSNQGANASYYNSAPGPQNNYGGRY